MGLGGVAIATLPSVIFPKLMFSDRLGGLTFGKINPEVLFYGTSGRDFMLLGVLPDSNSFL